MSNTYRNLTKELLRNRKDWLDSLNKNPDNSTAAENIIGLNAQLRLLDILRWQDGDYETIEA